MMHLNNTSFCTGSEILDSNFMGAETDGRRIKSISLNYLYIIFKYKVAIYFRCYNNIFLKWELYVHSFSLKST